MSEPLGDDTERRDGSGDRAVSRRRWIIAGAAVLVVAVVAFMVFRPDKLFVDDVVDEELDSDVAAVLDAATDTATTDTTTTAPPVLGQGDFVPQGGHEVTGSAFVVARPEGRLLVLPELDSENGPDLRLYLSPRSEGSVEGGVLLAPLKGNQGTQTYELPDDVDLSVQRNVVIWCERFDVPFGTATLA